MPGRETYSAMKRARELREAHGVPLDRPLDCVLGFAEEAVGVPVVVLPLPEGIDGAYLRRPAGTLIFVNGTRPVVRARFTLAHELGHHHLGHAGGIDTPASLADRQTRREADANAFAAELLFPRDAVLALAPVAGDWQPTLDEIVHIASAFGVSAQMVRIRLQTWRAVTDRDVLEALDAEIEAQAHLDRMIELGLDADGRADGLSRARQAMPRLPAGMALGPRARALLDPVA